MSLSPYENALVGVSRIKTRTPIFFADCIYTKKYILQQKLDHLATLLVHLATYLVYLATEVVHLVT